ncbi:hypothetical protein BJ165DRAFT_1563402 [Panaeolus papilionaceus]|nr:hypothetical protein BJ165DRAFT_1563402 [Panaeolus papilionaceus]
METAQEATPNWDNSEFHKWKITGDISVLRVARVAPGVTWRYLIIGPTGVGKSSVCERFMSILDAYQLNGSKYHIPKFVEALCGESQSLSISNNQLAGYTKYLTTYQLVNITNSGVPLYLIDTPGFSDVKFSEIELVGMIRKWLEDNDLVTFDGILFFTSVTDTRLAGSRLRTIEVFKAYLKQTDDLRSAVFVPTMWDALYHERIRERAESNFAQLRDNVFKEFIDGGAQITKFINTKKSALEVLHMTRYGTRNSVALDLAQPEAKNNIVLRTVLENNYRENEEILTKFIGQFLNLGPPPSGFEETHQRLQTSIKAVKCAPPVQLSLLPTAAIVKQHSTLEEGRGRDLLSIAEPSSANIVQLPPGHIETPTMKGLLRRLVRSMKRLWKKWFKK